MKEVSKQFEACFYLQYRDLYLNNYYEATQGHNYSDKLSRHRVRVFFIDLLLFFLSRNHGLLLCSLVACVQVV